MGLSFSLFSTLKQVLEQTDNHKAFNVIQTRSSQGSVAKADIPRA
jgi:hypothetical protein